MGFKGLAALAAVMLALTPLCARAQIASADEAALLRDGVFARDRNIAVRERPQPDYAPAGIHLGGFSLFPTLGLSGERNDNIYATPSNTVGDAILRVRPQLALRSNWSRNEVTAFARVDAAAYVDRDTENTTDYAFGAVGRLDIARSAGAAAGFSYARETEARTSPNSPVTALEPTRFDLADGYLDVAKAFGRLRLSGRGEVRDFTFDNPASRFGGVIYEKDRDRTELIGSGRAEYAVSPATSLFAAAAVNRRDYRNRLPTEAARSSDGAQVEFGANFDVTRLVRGEAALGYLDQDYCGRYASVHGATVRGRLEYFPTQITTVSLTAARTVEESILPSAGGYLSTNVAWQVDHELRRNIVLSAALSYGNDDYRGIDRTDDRFGVSAEARYVMNRGVAWSLRFEHLSQETHGAQRGLDYDQNRVVLGVSLRR